ncbi:MAG: hypothetical protein ACE5FS_01580 [Paracoccaceae bacterium]
MLRLLAYIPLGTAICLLGLDVALIAFTSFKNPDFLYADYFGLPSIAGVFCAAVGRYTVRLLALRDSEIDYDKLARTAERLAREDSHRKAPRVAMVSRGAAPEETAAVAHAS